MEIREIKSPPSRHRRKKGRGCALETLHAIHQARGEWIAAGRKPEHTDEFREAICKARDEIWATAPPPPPEPVVHEVVGVNEDLENGRLVRRAIVVWDDGAVGEALAWWPDSTDLDADQFVACMACDLDPLYMQSTGG